MSRKPATTEAPTYAHMMEASFENGLGQYVSAVTCFEKKQTGIAVWESYKATCPLCGEAL